MYDWVDAVAIVCIALLCAVFVFLVVLAVLDPCALGCVTTTVTITTGK